MKDFIPSDLPISSVDIVPPAIDPPSPRNMALADDTARQVLHWIGIELDRPLFTQVSRFDPWKDPLGVIEAYRLLREDFLASSWPWCAQWPSTIPRVGTSPTPS